MCSPGLKGPASGRTVLRPKLVDKRCQIQFPVELVDIAFRSFPYFFPKLA